MRKNIATAAGVSLLAGVAIAQQTRDGPGLLERRRARIENGYRMRSVMVASTFASAMVAACNQVDVASSESKADPRNAAQVALATHVYAQNCAICHGAKLEGQPDWRERLPNGRLPAPPHDESGHTWHHSEDVLFGITKHGLVPPYAPKDYESDMPAFGAKLSDEEIWAVLAYFKSHWKSAEVLSARQQMVGNK